MAYIGNQLSLISAGTLALYGATEGQTGIWAYTNTTDSISTVLGANYISDGMKRGMNLGDLVLFFDGTSLYLLAVDAVQSTPPFVPGQTTNFGVTLASVAPVGSTGNAALYTTAALQSATIPVGDVTGADFVVFDNTGTTPANLQLPTAAAIVAALPNAQVGFSYVLEVKNSSSAANTLTLTTNTGLTLTGTMTAAQNVARRLIVTITAIGASPAVTFQSFGVSGTGAD